MITAAQCLEASELLAEREEIAEQIERIKATPKVRIEYQYTYEFEKPDKSHAVGESWSNGPEMKPTPKILHLLLGGIETTLAEIDSKLRALGVEPPSADISEEN